MRHCLKTEMIAQGYGVLYGDESTVKTNIVDAYGYQKIKHITSVEVL